MIVIGVDPGVRASAMATIKDGDLIDLTMVGEGFLIIREALKLIPDDDYRRLVVENQFLGPNPKTFRQMVAARRDWQCAAADAGIPSKVIYPRTWQSKMLKCGNSKSREVKKFAKAAFVQLWGDQYTRTNEHKRDAALIAAYEYEQLLIAQHQHHQRLTKIGAAANG